MIEIRRPLDMHEAGRESHHGFEKLKLALNTILKEVALYLEAKINP